MHATLSKLTRVFLCCSLCQQHSAEMLFWAV